MDFLPSLSSLLGWKRVALHIIFLKLGGCLRAAIGGSLKTSFSSGFLKIIAVWCLLRTTLIFGSSGLKSMGATSLGFSTDIFCFFSRIFFRFSMKSMPGRFLIRLNCESMTFELYCLGIRNSFLSSASLVSNFSSVQQSSIFYRIKNYLI